MSQQDQYHQDKNQTERIDQSGKADSQQLMQKDDQVPISQAQEALQLANPPNDQAKQQSQNVAESPEKPVLKNGLGLGLFEPDEHESSDDNNTPVLGITQMTFNVDQRQNNASPEVPQQDQVVSIAEEPNMVQSNFVHGKVNPASANISNAPVNMRQALPQNEAEMQNDGSGDPFADFDFNRFKGGEQPRATNKDKPGIIHVARMREEQDKLSDMADSDNDISPEDLLRESPKREQESKVLRTSSVNPSMVLQNPEDQQWQNTMTQVQNQMQPQFNQQNENGVYNQFQQGDPNFMDPKNTAENALQVNNVKLEEQQLPMNPAIPVDMSGQVPNGQMMPENHQFNGQMPPIPPFGQPQDGNTMMMAPLDDKQMQMTYEQQDPQGQSYFQNMPLMPDGMNQDMQLDPMAYQGEEMMVQDAVKPRKKRGRPPLQSKIAPVQGEDAYSQALQIPVYEQPERGPRPHKTYDINTVFYDFKDFPDNKWEPYADRNLVPPGSFVDARGLENGERMERLLKGGTDKPILFDLQNAWLKGEQYAHILQNQDRYCQTFGIKKYDQKMHPETIYIDPLDGLLYFVEGQSIGSDFGFPRLGIRKRFKWKKMNFTTDLPKRDPLVSYIVASAVKCEKFFPGSNDDGPVYRMHAVILKKKDPKLQLPPCTDYIPAESQDSVSNQQVSQGYNDEVQQQQQQDMPRSSHGRVLTASRKLQQAKNLEKTQDKPNNQMPEKNYILCHVRRVMGKKDDDDEPILQVEKAPVVQTQKTENSEYSGYALAAKPSKIPNKTKKQATQDAQIDDVNLAAIEEQASQIKDIKKLGQLESLKKLSYEQIKKLKIGPDGKPLSNYMINKYIKPQLEKQHSDVDLTENEDDQKSGPKKRRLFVESEIPPESGNKRQKIVEIKDETLSQKTVSPKEVQKQDKQAQSDIHLNPSIPNLDAFQQYQNLCASFPFNGLGLQNFPIQQQQALQLAQLNPALLMQSSLLNQNFAALLNNPLATLLLAQNQLNQNNNLNSVLSNFSNQQNMQPSDSLDTAILPQLHQSQSQQFQRKRDQKALKKYDSTNIGERAQTNSPLMHNEFQHNNHLQPPSKSSRQNGASPSLNPLSNFGNSNLGALFGQSNRRLTAEGQSLTGIPNFPQSLQEYNRRLSDDRSRNQRKDSHISQGSKDFLYSNMSGLLKSPNLNPARPQGNDQNRHGLPNQQLGNGGRLDGLQALAAGGLGASTNNQRKTSLISGLGRNRLNSAFKKLDQGSIQRPDDDMRRDSGFFDMSNNQTYLNRLADQSFGQGSRNEQNSVLNTGSAAPHPIGKNISSEREPNNKNFMRMKKDKARDDGASSQNTANFQGNMNLQNYDHQKVMEMLMNGQCSPEMLQNLYHTHEYFNNIIKNQLQQQQKNNQQQDHKSSLELFQNTGNQGSGTGQSTVNKEGGSKQQPTGSGNSMDSNSQQIQGVFFSQSFGNGSKVTQFGQSEQKGAQKKDEVQRSRGQSGHNSNFINMLKHHLAPPNSTQAEGRQKQPSINMIIPANDSHQFNPKDSLIGPLGNRASESFSRISFNRTPEDKKSHFGHHKLSITAALLDNYQLQTGRFNDRKEDPLAATDPRNTLSPEKSNDDVKEPNLFSSGRRAESDKTKQ